MEHPPKPKRHNNTPQTSEAVASSRSRIEQLLVEVVDEY
jgi:hypothetical protein